MSYTLLDGKQVAKRLQNNLKGEVAELTAEGIVPHLCVICAGDDPASAIYIRNKERACAKLGIKFTGIHYEADLEQAQLLDRIAELNADATIDGILVQLPLPRQLDVVCIQEAVDPRKDVDGFHPLNVGLLALGRPRLFPCTPAGVMVLLDKYDCAIEGKRAVIVGRSNIVGKPLSLMLLQNNATVIICHSRTRDLEREIKSADILVVAIGKPRFIPGDWVKDGAVVIDVGMHRLDDGSLCGDIQFESATAHARYITPVPGGVGPMTIALLMQNIVTVARTRK